MTIPFCLLSLDGGGTWALMQAKALRVVHSGKTSDREFLTDFALIGQIIPKTPSSAVSPSSG